MSSYQCYFLLSLRVVGVVLLTTNKFPDVFLTTNKFADVLLTRNQIASKIIINIQKPQNDFPPMAAAGLLGPNLVDINVPHTHGQTYRRTDILHIPKL